MYYLFVVQAVQFLETAAEFTHFRKIAMWQIVGFIGYSWHVSSSKEIIANASTASNTSFSSCVVLQLRLAYTGEGHERNQERIQPARLGERFQ